MKYTYKWALKGTRQQAVNILHGRYLEGGGINPGIKGVGLCFGCAWACEGHLLDKAQERCKRCPTRHLAKRLGLERCQEWERSPEFIFRAIQVIDEMLEEANHVQSK